MSDESITLELVGSRLLTLTAQVHDLEQRFSGLEARFDGLEARFDGLERRFSAMERRYTVQEDRMSRMLQLIVGIAERQGVAE